MKTTLLNGFVLESEDNDIIKFEIIKLTGCGVMESPLIHNKTGLIFSDVDIATKEADRLWKEQTTEQERDDSWCDLHYTVCPIIYKNNE
jgi:hypothetical protein